MKKRSKITFQVENGWNPTKTRELDEYLITLVSTTKKLQTGQSIPLMVSDLMGRYGWKTANSCANAIRHVLVKSLSETYMSKIGVHEVKDAKGKITSIRIRHK